MSLNLSLIFYILPNYRTKFRFSRKTEFSVRSVRATMSVFPHL